MSLFENTQEHVFTLKKKSSKHIYFSTQSIQNLPRKKALWWAWSRKKAEVGWGFCRRSVSFNPRFGIIKERAWRYIVAQLHTRVAGIFSIPARQYGESVALHSVRGLILPSSHNDSALMPLEFLTSLSWQQQPRGGAALFPADLPLSPCVSKRLLRGAKHRGKWFLASRPATQPPFCVALRGADMVNRYAASNFSWILF